MRLLVFTEEPVVARGFLSVAPGLLDPQLEDICAGRHALVDLIRLKRPDMLLMDFVAEEHFDLLRQVRAAAPEVRVVLWTRRLSLETAYQTISAGVCGIADKTLSIEDLSKGLSKVAQGKLWFESDLTASVLQAEAVKLSTREGQLVLLVSQGLKNKEIATILGISEGTVRIYLSSLFRKLGINDRYELAIYGLRNQVALPALRTESAYAAEMPAPKRNPGVLVIDRRPISGPEPVETVRVRKAGA